MKKYLSNEKSLFSKLNEKLSTKEDNMEDITIDDMKSMYTLRDWEYEVDGDTIRLVYYKGNDNHVILYPDVIENGSKKNITFAEEKSYNDESGEWKWTIPIFGFGRAKYGDINIPNNKSTTEISIIEKIILPEYAISIFDGCTNLETIHGFENLDFTNTAYLSSMFYSCRKLNRFAPENTIDGNIINMNMMFYECWSMEVVDLRNFTNLHLIGMTSMFYDCRNLKHIYFPPNITIENDDTCWLNCTFLGCTNLEELDLSTIVVNKIDNANGCFYNCKKLRRLDLRGFDVSNATNLSWMFEDCINLTEIIVSRDRWVIQEGCNTTDMFKNCGVDHVTYVD